MIELLAMLAADPMSGVMFGVLLLAAGMYPVGFMFWSACSVEECPFCKCSVCYEGELPETVTVAFSGFNDKIIGPDLITLGFSACFGGGAAGRVTAPGGDPETDKGPITGVSLTNGGSGYAKLGRVAPTLTVSGGSGTGATFTPTLTSSNDACGIPTWKLESVAVTGGTGYVDGESLTITAAEGDTEIATATATVSTPVADPSVSASVSGGTGATLTVTLEESGGWFVSAVTVVNGGTGYTDGDPVTFTPTGGTTADLDADGFIVVGRTEPTVTVNAESGTGADLSVTLSQETDEFGDTFWTVLSVAVIDGGTGYLDGEQVTFTVTDGTSEQAATGYLVVTDGVITAVDVPYSTSYPYDSGYYYKSTGVIESVVVVSGGSYYNDSGTGVPTSVTVTNGGQYYREDASIAPYVADVTVTITQQLWPSAGTGAEITATVEDDTGSPDFGKITEMSVSEGGDGYLAYILFDSCLSRFNDRSLVLKRGAGLPTTGGIGWTYIDCLYTYQSSSSECSIGTEVAVFEYRGADEPVKLSIGFVGGGVRQFSSAQADHQYADCSNFNLEFTEWSGVTSPEPTATVTGGGTYIDPPPPTQEITQEEVESLQFEISWDGQSWSLFEGTEDGLFASGGCGYNAIAGAQGYDEEIISCAGIAPSATQCKIERSATAGIAVAFRGCSWGWRGSSAAFGPVDEVRVWRSETSQFTGTAYSRLCSWDYPILNIPMDADGYPSGELLLGDPTYSTAANDPNNYHPEGRVCADPGVPTITVSRLP